jgi:cell division protein FtsL
MTAPIAFSGRERLSEHRRRWVLVGVVVFVGVLAGLFLSRALEIRHLQQELIQLEAEKAKIQKEIERLSAQLSDKGNLKLVEYLARKELGMVKPGEQIYILIEDGEEEP